MADMYVMERANIFCGAHDPNASKHLTLTELKLPALTEVYQEHVPGGAYGRADIPLGLEKLEVTFKLTGFDPDLMNLFGTGQRLAHDYTAYGSLRDQRSGATLALRAAMKGRLGKIEPEAFKQGDLVSNDYSVMGITHYELHFDGREKYYWDLFTNAWRVDGVDQAEDGNRNIGLA